MDVICKQCNAPLITKKEYSFDGPTLSKITIEPCEACYGAMYDDGVRDGRRIPEKDGE